MVFFFTLGHVYAGPDSLQHDPRKTSQCSFARAVQFRDGYFLARINFSKQLYRFGVHLLDWGKAALVCKPTRAGEGAEPVLHSVGEAILSDQEACSNAWQWDSEVQWPLLGPAEEDCCPRVLHGQSQGTIFPTKNFKKKSIVEDFDFFPSFTGKWWRSWNIQLIPWLRV